MAELSKENEQLRPITNSSEKVQKEEKEFKALKYVFIFFSIYDCVYVHPNKCYFCYLFKFLVFFSFFFLLFFRAQYKLLKDELINEKKKNFSSQFNELGKKYLYMIEYSGEQTYNE